MKSKLVLLASGLVLAVGMIVSAPSSGGRVPTPSTVSPQGVWDGTASKQYPWRDHRKPFDFLFGNHFDMHQQTGLLPNGDLAGYLYVVYTGKFTPQGYPIAMHADCGMGGAECRVGWVLRGKRGHAASVFHQAGDHPLWLVDSRSDIPQPGGFGHFHWLGMPADDMGLMTGQMYDGYFLELQAVDTFFFLHGEDDTKGVLVRPGLDLATHLNIVASFPSTGGGH
jgi:hypothetical protein